MMNKRTWKEVLQREGFVHIPNALGSDHAERLAAVALQALDDYAASEDLIWAQNGTPLKLLYPLGKYPDFIAVLGLKEVRDIVDALIPKHDSVLTWEDVLIKAPNGGADVGPHQDIGLDAVTTGVHSLGISLHHDDGNPVCFLPGSHRLGPLTATAVGALWRECRKQFTPVVTEPGDIVIHNTHVLHSSGPNLAGTPRATWYLEFRGLRHLLTHGPWGADWAYQRRAIWVYARAAGGEDIGHDEPKAVRRHLERLGTDSAFFRVPHVTETTQYDPASPYNHFARLADNWQSSEVAPQGTHHLGADGRPLYAARFAEVLKFHPPGLAPVRDASGAYHITPEGLPAYRERYLRTFGFYEGRAAVRGGDGWYHILPDGGLLQEARFAWCGNYQDGRCSVRDDNGDYFHLTADGAPAYPERHRYAGDFRDGIAVVQRADGRHSHIAASGNLLHGRWFLNLDVYHKGHARARDGGGWCHVDMEGEPLYHRRFGAVEPFYNGQARVEGFDGALTVIDESGRTVLDLRPSLGSTLQDLSGEMVGHWRTQAIRAGVELGVFEGLPASGEELERSLGLAPSMGLRLLRGLAELGLVEQDDSGRFHATERGAFLRCSHPMSLADAALHWGGAAYDAWAGVLHSLRTGSPALSGDAGSGFFAWLQERPEQQRGYQAAMASYARHDYSALAHAMDLRGKTAVLDAGGGTGALSFALLRANPRLTATIMDRADVVPLAAPPDDVADRCTFIAGDLFARWPARSEAVVLARVLHDWPHEEAQQILRRAREAISPGGHLYVIEMVLAERAPRGGLLDLHMLVTTGGRERTAQQFNSLLAGAGFRLLEVTPSTPVTFVIRALAV